MRNLFVVFVFTSSVAALVLPSLAFANEFSPVRMTSADGKNPESLFSRSYKSCMSSGDAAKDITYAMINCKEDELSRQDTVLNEIYRKALKDSVSEEARKELRAVEEKWIKARDAMCEYEGADAGEGSASSVAHVDCMLRMTAARVQALKRSQAY